MFSWMKIEIVILDEADRMADMGFTEPVCQILEEVFTKATDHHVQCYAG